MSEDGGDASPSEPGVLARVVDLVRTGTERNLRSARNGLRHYARLDRPPIASTPSDIVWQRDKVKLLRYRSDQRGDGPPLILVHSLVNRSYIFDLVPGNSMVEVMLARGLDVYLIEWGVPDAADAENTLETYCTDYLPSIVDEVARRSGTGEVDMLGYCFGGILSLLYAAAHPDAPIRRLITMATPIDNTKMPIQLRGDSPNFVPDLIIDETGNVPGDTIGTMIRSLRPTADLAASMGLLANLWDDDYVAAHNAMTMWGDDQIPFAGAAFRQTSKMLSHDNGFINDDLNLGGKKVSLADITVPFLNVYGTKDHIVPADATRPLTALIGSEDVTDLELDAGHVGLFIGRRAHKNGVPAMVNWLAGEP